ncbi:MAG: transposase [Deltaproteobacteria bacterium RIFOXYD12_FULL_57_12]|nr:MAG: transposase [Deltaproteobacteria bacterium RIFOXYD12_FULL_57_12]
MPRKTRIDAPGALHHIIVRGIERKKIFKDDTDRVKFLERLGAILTDTKTHCLAWTIIPNHFHLLLRTGATLISSVMRRLLTGYAIYFNRRHRRSGHLFQNRYKSILCQEDAYLLELVRYIHLNPVRAKLVTDYNEFSNYPFCGHSAIMGKVERDWQDTDFILRMFDEELSVARPAYQLYVQDGIAMGKRGDLVGGGLIRSQGGWAAVRELRRSKAYQKGDERILGDGDFVEGVLLKSEEKLERKSQLTAQGINFDKAVERVAGLFEIPSAEVLAGGKKRQTVAARSLLCFWVSCELGLSQAWLARRLGISQPAVSSAVNRGRKLADDRHYSLVD